MSPRDSLDDGGFSPSDPERSYPGEDTRATSTKELAGWYMYAFAAETYVICGICKSTFRAPCQNTSMQQCRETYRTPF